MKSSSLLDKIMIYGPVDAFYNWHSDDMAIQVANLFMKASRFHSTFMRNVPLSNRNSNKFH